MNTKLAKTQSAILLVAGALLILVGAYILFAPATFYAANGIELGNSPSLVNELTAPAGLLLAAGLFVLGAVFSRRLADTATALAALVYLSYALARGLAMVLVGIPAAGLVQAAALEGVIGLACLVLVLLRRWPARGIA